VSLIDVGVLLVLLWVGWRGFRAGLTGALAWIAAVALTPYAAGYLTPSMAAWLAADVPDLPALFRQPAAIVLAVALSGVLIAIVTTILFGQVRRLMRFLPGVYKADQVAGALVAMAIGVAGLGLVTSVVSGLLSEAQRERIASSVWGGSVMPRLTPLAQYALTLIPGFPWGEPGNPGTSEPGNLGEASGAASAKGWAALPRDR